MFRIKGIMKNGRENIHELLEMIVMFSNGGGALSLNCGEEKK